MHSPSLSVVLAGSRQLRIPSSASINQKRWLYLQMSWLLSKPPFQLVHLCFPSALPLTATLKHYNNLNTCMRWSTNSQPSQWYQPSKKKKVAQGPNSPKGNQLHVWILSYGAWEKAQRAGEHIFQPQLKFDSQHWPGGSGGPIHHWARALNP